MKSCSTGESGDVLSQAACAVWAKSGYDLESRDVERWLPLVVHLADCAAVADLLWERFLSDSQRELLTSAFSIDAPDSRWSCQCAQAYLRFLCGVHDIGKATPIFAAKQPVLYDRMVQAGLARFRVEGAGRDEQRLYRHAGVGQVELEEYLRQRHGWTLGQARQAGSIIGAHHGVAMELRDCNEIKGDPHIAYLGDEGWKDVRWEIVEWMERRSGLDAYCDWLRCAILPDAWMMMASGIVVMADWIASNTDLFPLMAMGDMSVERILEPQAHAERVDRAWKALNLSASWASKPVPATVSEALHMLCALPDDARARPCQEKAFQLAASMDMPGMMIVEDVMGSGKTEAALLAANIMARRCGLNGVAVALPTQATTNAMFSRVLAWAEASAQHGEKNAFRPFDIRLLHGRDYMNRLAAKKKTLGYQWLYSASAGNRLDKDGTFLSSDIDDSGESLSHPWFSRKKSLLSSVVVTTIDHVLFSVLKAPHMNLRQLGLSGKAVIIDEVHSYDVYTEAFIFSLLQWLGAYGVPVVVLSATLTSKSRRRLCESYWEGARLRKQYGIRAKEQSAKEKPKNGSNALRQALSQEPAGLPSREAGDRGKREKFPMSDEGAGEYPLITVCSHSGGLSCPVAKTGSVRVGLDVWVSDSMLVKDLKERLSEGGCALVVRNTVSLAQDTYDKLRAEFPDEELMLVHARFAIADREYNDQRLLELFGKETGREGGAAPGRPQKFIVVSTQVVEQSLDVDFDVLYTDVAPIDLLFQRMGRVHRHGGRLRPARVAHPQCIVFGVPRRETFDMGIMGAYSKIYDLSILLQTSLALRAVADSAGQVCLPDDMPGLLEKVYGQEFEVPAAWEDVVNQSRVESHQQEDSQRSRAQNFCLGPPGCGSDSNLMRPMEIKCSDSDPNEQMGAYKVGEGVDAISVLLVDQRDDEWWTMPVRGCERSIFLDDSCEPESEAVDALALSEVKLPFALCVGAQGDRVIAQLEGYFAKCALWQKNPVLAGKLVLPFVEGEAEVGGVRLTYDRRYGLRQKKSPLTRGRVDPVTSQGIILNCFKQDNCSEKQ